MVRGLAGDKGALSEGDIQRMFPATGQKFAAKLLAWTNKPTKQIPDEFRSQMLGMAKKAQELAQIERAAKVGKAFNDYKGMMTDPTSEKSQLNENYGNVDLATKIMKNYNIVLRNPKDPNVSKLYNIVQKDIEKFFSGGIY
jgi:hypothetical protein